MKCVQCCHMYSGTWPSSYNGHKWDQHEVCHMYSGTRPSIMDTNGSVCNAVTCTVEPGPLAIMDTNWTGK